MIYYSQIVTKKDIPRLDKATKLRIKTAILKKLSANPVLYGTPLNGIIRKLWKLRVGDYRVVYSIEKNNVFIWGIGHRKEIYNLILKRV